MNSLKEIAVKAKSRLLNKGLRDSYFSLNNYNNSTTAISLNNTNNFFNKNNNENEKRKTLNYLMREDKLMCMSKEDREKYILDSIRKYQEEKHRLSL